jgi:SOS-response transcriptional repressor LexA
MNVTCPHCGGTLMYTEPPTKVERKLLESIEYLTGFFNRPPSYRELADYEGYDSLGTVSRHVANMKRKGLLLPTQRRSKYSLVTMEYALRNEC